MTPFASVALYKRNGSIVFRPPRKERSDDLTQARKSASRHWRSAATSKDKLVKIVLLREVAGRLEISERAMNENRDMPWIEYMADLRDAAHEPHLAACMAELGIDPTAAPMPLPDVIVVNGQTYRRDI